MRDKRFYHPELDVLRFVAFLFIFLDHGGGAFHSRIADLLSEAFRLGLPLFFVLSSYLISELLLRERETVGTVHIRAFYLRRILRIWPLYFTALACSYIAGLLGRGFFPASALIAFITLSGNWYSYTHNMLLPGVGILWSISVEEQFYLVWPVLLKLGSQAEIKVTICLLVAVSSVALLYSSYVGINPTRLWFNSFFQFGYFALGAGLCLAVRKRAYRPSKAHRAYLLLTFVGCFAGLIFFAALIASNHSLPAAYLTSTFAALLAVASLTLFLAFFNYHVSESSYLVRLGRISYGLYVFHLFALEISEASLRHLHRLDVLKPILSLALALLLTIILAHLSYAVLELPFLRLKRRFTFVQSRTDMGTQM